MTDKPNAPAERVARHRFAAFTEVAIAASQSAARDLAGTAIDCGFVVRKQRVHCLKPQTTGCECRAKLTENCMQRPACNRFQPLNTGVGGSLCIQLRVPEREAGHSTAYPLSPLVGQAILEYLKTGRPTTTSRRMFFRTLAPCEPIRYRPGWPLIGVVLASAKFKDLNLGLVDGTVAALAERRQVYRVLTTDRRDFSAIRIGPRLSRALELMPPACGNGAFSKFIPIRSGLTELTQMLSAMPRPGAERRQP